LTYDLDLSAKRITPFYFNEKYDRTLAVTASRRPELYGDLVEEKAKKKALKEIAGKKKGRGAMERGPDT